jgi:outer membrane protein assembly factor BamE (lipoprotein component of BamABCDE complex)
MVSGFIIVLTCIFFVLTGCIAIPIPTTETKLLAGKPVVNDQISLLIPEITAKEEVLQIFGNPNVIWEDARIFSYNWDKRQAVLLWAVGGYGGGTGGIADIPKQYHLLIQFDEQGRVQRFERAVRPLTQSYIDFLIDWRNAANRVSQIPE